MTDAVSETDEALVEAIASAMSIKDRKGKYGRYLAIIYTPEQELSINDRLVLHGHAVHRDY